MSKDFNKVLEYFEKLTTIPRGSENTEGIKNYLLDFAEKRSLRCRTDSADNVVIFKPASKQFEGKQPIILQGHTDMVCAKEDGYDIDFLTQPLTLQKDGDFLSAKGTSLGADDGIAVAMMLALLDSDLGLPALECIFTSDEEIGMIGATALDISDIEGKYLINADSEDEGVLTVSCAGGSTAVVSIPVNKEQSEGYLYEIGISGLAGGHSGTEIIKGGLNANCLLGEVLKELKEYKLVSISGGEKENAIAARAKMTLLFEEETDICPALEKVINENRGKEPGIKAECVFKDRGKQLCFDEDSTKRTASALISMPQGIIKMSEFDKTAVQTSLNLGVLEEKDGAVKFTFSVRSSVEKEREELENELGAIAEANGGSLALSGIYPGWEYKQNSVLREKAVEVFEKLFGYSPKVESIHAGLECGVLISKKPELECISLGPQLYDVHTARERLSISSAERTWEYLTELILTLGKESH